MAGGVAQRYIVCLVDGNVLDSIPSTGKKKKKRKKNPPVIDFYFYTTVIVKRYLI
jgi:hypothetical protein